MEGYIQGYLWEVIREQYRWFKRAIIQPSHSPLKPVEVFERTHGDKCQFIVKLREEELKGAFDALSDAKESVRIKNFDKCANDIRTSVELAFKEKVCMNRNEKTSVLRLMKSFKNRNLQLKYRTIDDIYALTSRAIHGSGKLNEKECKDMINEWCGVLESLEMLQIQEPERHEIENEVLNTQ